jgi:hypothetical protein
MTSEELKRICDILQSAGLTVVAVDVDAFVAHLDAVERRHRTVLAEHHRLAS